MRGVWVSQTVAYSDQQNLFANRRILFANQFGCPCDCLTQPPTLYSQGGWAGGGIRALRLPAGVPLQEVRSPKVVAAGGQLGQWLFSTF